MSKLWAPRGNEAEEILALSSKIESIKTALSKHTFLINYHTSRLHLAKRFLKTLNGNLKYLRSNQVKIISLNELARICDEKRQVEDYIKNLEKNLQENKFDAKRCQDSLNMLQTKLRPVDTSMGKVLQFRRRA